MDIARVCVIGGSGFVGSHIVQLLSAERYQVRVPTRNRERAKRLILLPTVDVVSANVHDEADLDHLVRGMGAVINLVGVLHGGRGAHSFSAAHVDLTRKIIAACGRTGVRRYVHMSALGAATDGPSEYQRTKGEAETLVRASNLDWTIFRPSVIFGAGDRFINMFATLLKWLPVLPLGGANARFQPVYVEDAANAFVTSLDSRPAFGKIYELCGPKVYTLREIVEVVGRLTGHRRPVIGLGGGLSYLQAFTLEVLPGRLMSRDNYHSMKVDNVSSERFPFGIQPTSLEAVAPAWLGNQAPRARYRVYRDHAGRTNLP